jgi:hypothetical protein
MIAKAMLAEQAAGKQTAAFALRSIAVNAGAGGRREPPGVAVGEKPQWLCAAQVAGQLGGPGCRRLVGLLVLDDHLLGFGRDRGRSLR